MPAAPSLRNGLLFPETILESQFDRVRNIDSDEQPEQKLDLPGVPDKTTSWLDYRCWLEVSLDPGTALHKPLPQSPQQVDTLASQFVSPLDAEPDENIAGANMASRGHFADVVQQMATAEYIFMLRGFATRVGYRIPIPGLKTVAGVEAIPAERQFSRELLYGNLNGIPVFFCQWDLWYHVILPPKQTQQPPANFCFGIRPDVELPDKNIVPLSPRDSNAIPSAKQGFFVGKVK